MAVFAGPDIVHSGLVLHLDAANGKSYAGSGTLITNLANNNKSGTLINGVGFSSQSLGAWVFDRVDDQVQLSNSYDLPSLPIAASSRTLIACFRTGTTIASPYEHIMHYGSAAGSQAYGIAIFNQAFISNHTWAGTSFMSSQTVSTLTNYWVAITYNNNATPRNTYFVNGVVGTVAYGQGRSADYEINTGSALPLLLGSRVSPGERFGGQIHFVQIYNRDLTVSEIQQNFEATRGRYGI